MKNPFSFKPSLQVLSTPSITQIFLMNIYKFVLFLGQLVVVTEGKDFLAGEDMANILVIHTVKKTFNLLILIFENTASYVCFKTLC
jgi:hypothetical protein